MKEWTSPIYAFFEPKPLVKEQNGRHSHLFKCASRSCKTTIRHYLDTKDARSTGNMRKHARKCWGDEPVSAADDAKDVNEAHTKVVGGILKNGKITQSFEHKGKERATYSNIPHTCTETRMEVVWWVSESLRPFTIVGDQPFLSLMKTGRPNYYLPSEYTISRDVRHDYNGCLNFTTDTWSSPNHHSFVAICVHLERNGSALTMPLDVVEVAKA
ncbi:hypothetical protein OG21DRAFT_1478846 [Imleria badia]|nr:hypothetical protein OG21DRAFT_1478846 [Imleria badia]